MPRPSEPQPDHHRRDWSTWLIVAVLGHPVRQALPDAPFVGAVVVFVGVQGLLWLMTHTGGAP